MKKPQPLTYEYTPRDLRLRISGVDDVGRSFHIVFVGEENWSQLIDLARELQQCLDASKQKESA